MNHRLTCLAMSNLVTIASVSTTQIRFRHWDNEQVPFRTLTCAIITNNGIVALLMLQGFVQ